MNREEIKKVIPHREPMLLIDEAEAVSETTGKGHYTVKGDEWFLQGHFPGNPTVPGVILCEMMAQCACSVLGDKISGRTTYFTSLDKVRIRKPVVPGNRFDIEVVFTNEKANFFFVDCKGYVNEKLCISGSFCFAAV